jgi:hypothetical protein
MVGLASLSWPDLVPVSWPGMARPSTPLPVSALPVVDGRHKAGHDTGGGNSARDTGTPLHRGCEAADAPGRDKATGTRHA